MQRILASLCVCLWVCLHGVWPVRVWGQGLEGLRLNEIQNIGSHNSYRLSTDLKIERFALSLKGVLPAEYNPEGWDYCHAPLREQLEMHRVRSMELDIYHDPLGGRFAKAAGRLLTGRRMRVPGEGWVAPGMKLLHIADFDYHSSQSTLVAALEEIREWSQAHPSHFPLCIMIEPKSFGVSSLAPFWPFTPLLPFDGAALDALDKEVLSVFPKANGGIFCPDMLRGGHPDLQSALKAEGWPLLDDLRGKVYFVAMLSGEEQRAYSAGHLALADRAMFYFGEPEDPNVVFVKRDEPQGQVEAIKALVGQGFIVRTRADADTREARSGDGQRLLAALASGAQMVSTDYYLADRRAGKPGWSDYRAVLPDGQIAVTNHLWHLGPGQAVGE